MINIIIFIFIYSPLFMVLYYMIKTRLRLYYIMYLILSIIIFIAYFLVLLIIYIIRNFRYNMYYKANEYDQHYGIKAFYSSYYIYIEYWKYIHVYIYRFFLIVLYSLLYIYINIIKVFLYKTDLIYIYMFIKNNIYIYILIYYKKTFFYKLVDVYYFIKNNWFESIIWDYLPFYATNSKGRIPMINIEKGDPFFEEGMSFEYSYNIKYPFFKGSLLYVSEYLKKGYFIILLLSNFINLIYSIYYKYKYKNNLNNYYKYIFNLFRVIFLINRFTEKNWVNNIIINLKDKLLLIYYCIEIIIFNMLYIFIYIFLTIIKIIILFLLKNYKKMLYILIILFILNFFVFFSFMFKALIDHYLLYFPYINFRNSLRHLKFQMVDKRNFYFLINFSNKLSDLNIIDNQFYNQLSNDLCNSLNNVYFKTRKGIYPLMYNVDGYIDKDTSFLQKIFSKYNGSKRGKKWKKFFYFQHRVRRFLKKHSFFWHKNYFLLSRVLKYKYYKVLSRKRLHYERKGKMIQFYKNLSHMNLELKTNPFLYNYSSNKFYNYNIEEYKESQDKWGRWKKYKVPFKDLWKIKRFSLARPRMLLINKYRYETLYDKHMYFDLIKFIDYYKMKMFKSKMLFYNWREQMHSFNHLIQTINKKLGLVKKSNYIYTGLLNSIKGYIEVPNLSINFYKSPIDAFSFLKLRGKHWYDLKELDLYELTVVRGRNITDKSGRTMFVSWADPPANVSLKKKFVKRRKWEKRYPFRIKGEFLMKKSNNLIKLKSKIIPFVASKLLNKRIFMDLTININRYRKALKEVSSVKRFWRKFDKFRILKHNLLLPSDINDKLLDLKLSERKRSLYMKKRFFFFKYKRYVRYRKLAIKFILLLKYYNNMSMDYTKILPSFLYLKKPYFGIWLFKYIRRRLLFITLVRMRKIELFLSEFKDFFLLWVKFKKEIEGKRAGYKIRELNLKKVITFKRKIYRKIFQLKKFAYLRSQYKTGNILLKYLKSFSINYYIKHLLWHSPLNSLYFWQNNYYYESSKNNKISLFYFKNSEVISTYNYSFIFNFFLNCTSINDNCGNLLTNISFYDNDIRWSELSNKTFFNYYNYGNSRYCSILHMEYYRIVIVLIFKYYDKILYNIYKLSYILKEKNYGLYYFLNRKWRNIKKKWFNLKKLRLRLTIVKSLGLELRFRKRWRNVDTRRSNRYNFRWIPFWFIYNYYIKIFIDFLLTKYFVKKKFLLWWLSYKFDFNIFFLLIIKIYKFLFKFKLYIDIYYLIIDNIKSIILNNVMDTLKIYLCNLNFVVLWYLNLFFVREFMFYYIKILLSLDNLGNKIILIKLILLKLFYYLKDLGIKFNDKVIDLKLDLKSIMLKTWGEGLTLKNIFFYIFDIKNGFFYLDHSDKYYKRGKRKRKIRKNKAHRYPFWKALPFRHTNYLKRHNELSFFFNSIHLYSLRTFYFVYNDIYMFDKISQIFSGKQLSLSILNMRLLGLKFLRYYYIIYILFFVFIYIFLTWFYRIFFPSLIDVSSLNENNEYTVLENGESYWRKFRNKSINFFLGKPIYYIKWFYKDYYLKKKFNNFNYKWLFISKRNLLYKFVNCKKWNSFLYYLHDAEFQELDPLKVTSNLLRKKFFFKIFKTYLNLVDNIVFKNKIPYFLCFKDYDTFSLIKRNNLYYRHIIFDDYQLLFACLFYWLMFFPCFFFFFVLKHYHICYIKYKSIFKFSCLLRSLLGEFEVIHNFCKFFEKFSFYHRLSYRRQFMDPNYLRIKDKKRMRKSLRGFMRTPRIFYNLLPLGPYYYWFHKINNFKYFSSFKVFYMKSIIFSNLFFYFFIFFSFILIYIKIYSLKRFKMVMLKSSIIFNWDKLIYIMNLHSCLNLKTIFLKFFCKKSIK